MPGVLSGAYNHGQQYELWTCVEEKYFLSVKQLSLLRNRNLVFPVIRILTELKGVHNIYYYFELCKRNYYFAIGGSFLFQLNIELCEFRTTMDSTGTGSVKFTPPMGFDPLMKGGVPTHINTQHQCITAMSAYQHKTLEELRWEDYNASRKPAGKVQSSIFTNIPFKVRDGPFGINIFGPFGIDIFIPTSMVQQHYYTAQGMIPAKNPWGKSSGSLLPTNDTVSMSSVPPDIVNGKYAHADDDDADGVAFGIVQQQPFVSILGVGPQTSSSNVLPTCFHLRDSPSSTCESWQCRTGVYANKSSSLVFPDHSNKMPLFQKINPGISSSGFSNLNFGNVGRTESQPMQVATTTSNFGLYQFGSGTTCVASRLRKPASHKNKSGGIISDTVMSTGATQDSYFKKFWEKQDEKIKSVQKKQSKQEDLIKSLLETNLKCDSAGPDQVNADCAESIDEENSVNGKATVPEVIEKCSEANQDGNTVAVTEDNQNSLNDSVDGKETAVTEIQNSVSYIPSKESNNPEMVDQDKEIISAASEVNSTVVDNGMGTPTDEINFVMVRPGCNQFESGLEECPEDYWSDESL